MSGRGVPVMPYGFAAHAAAGVSVSLEMLLLSAVVYGGEVQ